MLMPRLPGPKAASCLSATTSSFSAASRTSAFANRSRIFHRVSDCGLAPAPVLPHRLACCPPDNARHEGLNRRAVELLDLDCHDLDVGHLLVEELHHLSEGGRYLIRNEQQPETIRRKVRGYPIPEAVGPVP